MRIFLPILLIFVISISSFKHAAIFVSFKLNQAAIAKNLCIERDIEESTCGGCCQLKKKQEEQQEKEEAPNPQRKLKVNMEWFCQHTLFIGPKNSLLKEMAFAACNNFYQSIENSDCFHPPQYC